MRPEGINTAGGTVLDGWLETVRMLLALSLGKGMAWRDDWDDLCVIMWK